MFSASFGFKRAACSSLNNLEINLTRRANQFRNKSPYTTLSVSQPITVVRRHPLQFSQRCSQLQQQQQKTRVPRFTAIVRQAHSYQRFGNRQSAPGFRINRNYLIAGGVGFSGFYAYNLERVPVSNRLRFNVISSETETEMSKEAYKQILQDNSGKILPPGAPAVRMVNRVMERLIPVSGLQDQDWEVFVVYDQTQKNAFVIPGGKVFVFSGLLDITQNDDGLATVLSHEISHCIAHHSAERMSQMYILAFGINMFAFLFGAPVDFTSTMANLLLDKPASRKQESEADYLGLLMMASACYDPMEAQRFWGRMEKALQGSEPPQFLSTHPSNTTRMRDVEKWMPEANEKRQTGDCSTTIEHVESFHSAFDQLKW